MVRSNSYGTTMEEVRNLTEGIPLNVNKNNNSYSFCDRLFIGKSQ